MRSYYYLVAQLPYLIFGQQPPMSSEEFKELASSCISKNDMDLLNKISLSPLNIQTDSIEDDEVSAAVPAAYSYEKKAPSSGSVFIDKWREWERSLRLALAKSRAAKLGRQEPEAEMALFDDVAIAVQKAMEVAESPMEAEWVVDKARWHAIEEYQGSNYFSCNTILAYMLKLLILERHANFNVNSGYSEYKSLYASIMEQGAVFTKQLDGYKEI